MQRAHREWSPWYRSEEHRLVVPRSAFFAARLSGGEALIDSNTAWWLDPSREYAVRQPVLLASFVVTLHGREIPRREQSRVPRRAWCGPAQHFALHRIAAGSNEPARELWGEEMLVAVIDALAPENNDIGNGSARTRKAAAKAREIVAAAPHVNLSLSDIARLSGLSPFHLARAFRRENGTGLHAYRTRLRIARALNALRDGADDLTGLALDLGFSSHSHFTATFRRLVGTTPALARRAVRARARS